jgi:hypothetical protein
MLGEIDGIDFVLAENLGMSLEEVGQLSSLEITKWKAWHHIQHEMQKLAEATNRSKQR